MAGAAAGLSSLPAPLGARDHGSAFGVVAAADEELRALRRRLIGAKTTKVGNCRLVRGRLGEVPVVLARTGEGRGNAELGVRALLEREAVRGITIIGFSGGLSPGLSPGALLVAERIVDSGGAVAAPDPAWSSRIARCQGVDSATLVSVDRILCTPESKTELWGRIAQDLPAAADLETAAMAAVVASYGLPFVVIRAISDTADEALPLDFNDCLDESGRISRARIVARAALNPTLIAPLWRLRGRTRSCSESLADLACRSIEGESS